MNELWRERLQKRLKEWFSWKILCNLEGFLPTSA